ncbi:MAG: ATP-dependent helicase [bacterium]
MNINAYLDSLPPELANRFARRIKKIPNRKIVESLILEPWPLNHQQLRALLHDYLNGPPLLILAGAGSGKTAVMTRRIAWHILSGVSPESIIALTFTRRAAREMKDRVIARLENCVGYLPAKAQKYFQNILNNMEYKSWITTYHSACWRLLNQKLPNTDSPVFCQYNKKFQSGLTLLTPEERNTISFRLSRQLGNTQRTTEEIIIRSRDHRDQFKTTKQLFRESNSDIDYETARFMKEYKEFKIDNNLFDLQDIITVSARLLRGNEDVRRFFQSKFSCQLVDEFQDTSLAQLTFLARLVDDRKAICAVGDDYQAIYEWRGARPDLIRKFEKFFPGRRKIKLNYNYRSCGRILFTALELFPRRMIAEKRDLHPTRKLADGQINYGDHLIKFEAKTRREEAEYVAYEIARLVNKEGCSPGDFAIFYRNQAQKYPFVKALKNESIPLELVGTGRFFNQQVPRVLLNLVHLLVEIAKISRDGKPRGGQFGFKSDMALERWWSAALEKEDGAGEPPDFSTLVNEKKWDKFLDSCAPSTKIDFQQTRKLLFEWSREIFTGGYFNDLLPSIKKKLRLYRDRKLLNQFRRFKNWLVNMDFAPGSRGLIQIRDEAVLENPSITAEKETEREAVRLMTLHSCKGLQFKNVFIVGLEDGILPAACALKDKRKIEEEKRLLYVGITRAQDELYFSYALKLKDRSGWQKPSRFLEKIPSDYLHFRPARLKYSERFRRFFNI